jgi:L-lactate dehydrogenase
MTPDIRKCAIVGCGSVGATTAFSLMKSGLFSEMVLIDVDKRRVHGEAADLGHGLPFLAPMDIYAGDWRDTAGAGIIIIAAGVAQKPGETRLDLLRANTRIFADILGEICKYNSDAILLVVTNPVDVLTEITRRLSGFPAERVIGSGTVLDTARLKQMIGKELLVDSRNIHAFILGEHGDSELPVWSSANVSGIDLRDFYAICGHSYNAEDLNSMFEEVRDSAYKIIEGKGATYYAIAQAVMRITESIVRDEDSVLPVSAYLTGQYGINDVCLGVPSIVGKEGIRKILEIPLNREERKRLCESASVLRSEFEGILTSFC